MTMDKDPSLCQYLELTVHEILDLIPITPFCLLSLFMPLFLSKLITCPETKHDFLLHRIHHHPVYLSTLTLMKNEADYLLEWIEYHLLVGVERFFLVDNASSDNTTAIIQPYIALDLVRLKTYAGLHPQLAVYNKVLPMLRNETYWVAVIDIDEFIVPLEFHCIPPILHSLENEVGIFVHWVVYSSNGKEKKEEGLVIERFRAHASWNHQQNRFGKLISQPREVIQAHVHNSRYRSGTAVNLCNNKSQHRVNRKWPCHERMRINHYWTKSREEWIRKVARGQVYRYEKYNLSSFTMIDDDVRNDNVMDWYIPRVKANLVARNTFLPCHVVADPDYNENIQAVYQSANPKGIFSWMTAIIHYQQNNDMPGPAFRP
jgi:glycosyltransferase involved in cell wall biosynthesis